MTTTLIPQRIVVSGLKGKSLFDAANKACESSEFALLSDAEQKTLSTGTEAQRKSMLRLLDNLVLDQVREAATNHPFVGDIQQNHQEALVVAFDGRMNPEMVRRWRESTTNAFRALDWWVQLEDRRSNAIKQHSAVIGWLSKSQQTAFNQPASKDTLEALQEAITALYNVTRDGQSGKKTGKTVKSKAERHLRAA